VPGTYDPGFRRRVVELVGAGRLVWVVAADLGLAEATLYRKAQDLMDRGGKLGTSTSEQGELAAARLCAATSTTSPSAPVQRLVENLETEPRCSRRSERSAHAADADDGVAVDLFGSLVDDAGVHRLPLPHDPGRAAARAGW
jgi:hypothetical protein